ncbi:GCN5-related N-acetyltransferase [Catenulispora acidiphila DSM 44928]|uniref:GCN5-related N-acetyltransferase n=1 Tax=Catenulispora acidiphila (strain DSM 44928 / JCM 14897 / NBRC 102108 / NRRL B-24433 / ID139908) TaxID=479433 RepID=C7QAS8_CATAD|nr:GNAT family N-acetyltransferase [Catenulispora acidiphila]ACU74401.1 GCN5-related N-acetyltransferase [Catenulispora acidiphila DSM 44928]
MSESLILRDATAADLPAIVAMLADDKLGSTREDPEDLTPYLAAFAELEADPNQRLIVAERAGAAVGTFQLTFIPGVAQRGLKRAMIESVRVVTSERGSGLGTQMMRWAIDEARQAGCGQVQLTSNAARADAHRFYERLGFVPSHVGFKLKLA